MKLISVIFIIVTVVFTSCSFEEEFVFKSDWSGNYESKLDLSGLAEIGGEESDEGERKELIPLKEKMELEMRINSVKGISNADIISNDIENYIIFKYDFNHLDAINRLQRANLSDGDEDSPLEALGIWEMSHKGKKKFFMNMVGLDKFHESNEDDSQERMGEMLKVTTTLSFPRPIKSMISDIAELGSSKNQLIIEYSGKDLMNKEKSWLVEVKL